MNKFLYLTFAALVILPGTAQAAVEISEFLPDPAGTDGPGNAEFVELYNNGSAAVDLEDWIIDDSESSQSNFKKISATTIEPGKYVVFYANSSILNNSGDDVRLFDDRGNLLDTASYVSAPAGSSYAKISGNWSWSQSPTPGAANSILNNGVPATNAENSPTEPPPYTQNVNNEPVQTAPPPQNTLEQKSQQTDPPVVAPPPQVEPTQENSLNTKLVAEEALPTVAKSARLTAQIGNSEIENPNASQKFSLRDAFIFSALAGLLGALVSKKLKRE